MNRLRIMERRARRSIILDLIRFDLLTCKPVSLERRTQRLTLELPDMATEMDASNFTTVTMATEIERGM